MNTESNLFNPVDLDLSRSTFVGHPTRTGTCNAGRLIPVWWLDVQPGDSLKLDLRSLFKMSTPVYPTMDELFADVSFFFVPNKLVLGERYGSPSTDANNQTWKAIVGAQSNAVNVPIPASGLYVPSLKFSDISNPGCLMDYIYPGSNDGYDEKLSCLPVLAYFSIYNENYRDPNLFQPITWSFYSNTNEPGAYVLPYGFAGLYATKDEVLQSTGEEIDPDYELTNALYPHYSGDIQTSATGYANVWLPLPTCRFHGYLGSALPWPQRNTEGVELPLGEDIPVYAGDDHFKVFDSANAMRLMQVLNNTVTSADSSAHALVVDAHAPTSNSGVVRPLTATTASTGISTSGVVPSNLWADLSSATAANVNALRAAIQKQRWYEKLARSGNRYDELEYGLFGVRPKDSGLDRPLYLGGKRIPLNITMVASTNGGTSPSSAEGAGSLGSLGAFSHTNDKDYMFYHSFDDWGTVMCVFTIRHHTTIDGGIDKSWTRRHRDQMYFPTFAHLGEMAITGDEVTGDVRDATRVFGYQEAWADYRYFRDRVCGLFEDGQSLNSLTYAEKFDQGTTLTEYLNASYQVASVDKTLQVSSVSSGFQFIYQMTFDVALRRCMPEYSWPGLVDHF